MGAKRLRKQDARAASAMPEEDRAVPERLRISETRYRRLFETAKDGILPLDAETGEITGVNPLVIFLVPAQRTSRRSVARPLNSLCPMRN